MQVITSSSSSTGYENEFVSILQCMPLFYYVTTIKVVVLHPPRQGGGGMAKSRVHEFLCIIIDVSREISRKVTDVDFRGGCKSCYTYFCCKYKVEVFYGFLIRLFRLW